MQIQASIGLIFAVCRFWDKIGEHRYLQPFWSGERTFHLHSEVDEASRREQHHAPSGVASLSPIILSRRSRWSRQSQAHHESSDSGSLFASVSADPLVGGDL